jgi:hypothetical protein
VEAVPLGFVRLRAAVDAVGRKVYPSSWRSIEERLPLTARLRVQRQEITRPKTDGWLWDVISVEQVIAEGIADTEAAAWQAARGAARKANLVIDAPIESDQELRHVITVFAEACESGEIASAYRSITERNFSNRRIRTRTYGGVSAEKLDHSVWQVLPHRLVATGTIGLDLPLLDEQGRPPLDRKGRPVANPPTVRCTCEILVRQRDLDVFLAALSTIAPRGRSSTHDWVEGELYALKLLGERGDPTVEENQDKNWKNKSDLARAVQDHLEKRDKVAPDLSLVRRKVPGWLAKFRKGKVAQN